MGFASTFFSDYGVRSAGVHRSMGGEVDQVRAVGVVVVPGVDILAGGAALEAAVEM